MLKCLRFSASHYPDSGSLVSRSRKRLVLYYSTFGPSPQQIKGPFKSVERAFIKTGIIMSDHYAHQLTGDVDQLLYLLPL